MCGISLSGQGDVFGGPSGPSYAARFWSLYDRANPSVHGKAVARSMDLQYYRLAGDGIESFFALSSRALESKEGGPQ